MHISFASKAFFVTSYIQITLTSKDKQTEIFCFNGITMVPLSLNIGTVPSLNKQRRHWPDKWNKYFPFIVLEN